MPRENAAGPGDTGANNGLEDDIESSAEHNEIDGQNVRPNGGKPSRGQRSEARGQKETSAEGLAKHLNLPAEVRQAISNAKPAAQRNERGADTGGPADGEGQERGAEGEEQRPTNDLPGDEPGEGNGQEQGAEGEGEGSQEGRADGEEEENAERSTPNSERPTNKQQPKAPKHWPPDVQREFNKRIGKIWQQKASLQNKLAAAEQVAGQFQVELDRIRAGAEEVATAAPQAGGILGNARNERQLEQLVGEAEAMLDLLDGNPEWLNAGTGEGANFRSPEEVRKWKSDAERILRGSERRREQIRTHHATKAEYDRKAQEQWPELFNPQSKEFQAALAIGRRYPWINGLPEGNYALGVMVEGFKAIGLRANGQGQGARGRKPDARGQNGDLDERLTPEYQADHIPPTAAPAVNQPSNRHQPVGRAFKDIESRMEKFTRPGAVASMNSQDLADILGMLRESENGSNGARRPVAV